MADEPIQPVVAPEAAPVVDVTPVTPVASVAPVTPEAPVVVEAAAPEAPPALPTDAPTLLEQFDKDNAPKPDPVVEAEKPVEAKVEATPEVKPEEVKPEEAKPVEAQPEPKPVEPEPIKFDYKLPESVVLPEAQQGELNEAFTAFARNPGSAEAQQKLIDFHVDRLNEVSQAAERHQHQTFADVRNRWQGEVKTHPVLGGGNFPAAMQAIAHVRDNFVSLEPRGSKAYESAKQRLDEFLHYTGAGDHPAFLELMHNVSTVLNEGQMTAVDEVKLIPQHDNGGRPSIYKHPTSNRNGR